MNTEEITFTEFTLLIFLMHSGISEEQFKLAETLVLKYKIYEAPIICLN